MTLLASYLAEQGMSQVEFARRSGVDRAMVSHYAQGDRKPGLTYALKIEQATGGAVPASYWSEFRPKRHASSRTAKSVATNTRPRRAGA